MKFKKYNKDFGYTYVLGVTPVIDSIKYKSAFLEVVYLSKNLKKELADEIVDLCRENNCRFEFDNYIFEKLAFKENTYAISILKKYNTKLEPEFVHIALVNPSNMGNLGTIIRTMLAFNIKNLAIIKPACDIFDPKVIASSMGAFFNINFEYFGNFNEYQKVFENRDIYTLMLDGANTLNEITFAQNATLIFGNEGEGLDPKYKKIGTSIRINHTNLVDSLNLGIAVGIVLNKIYNKL